MADTSAVGMPAAIYMLQCLLDEYGIRAAIYFIAEITTVHNQHHRGTTISLPGYKWTPNDLAASDASAMVVTPLSQFIRVTGTIRLWIS